MSFADENDMSQLMPDIYNHGVDDWSLEISRASEDIRGKIKTEWHNKRGGKWDSTKLDDAQWQAATLYRALAYYILPRLSQWRVEGDGFQNQMEFYQARYAEEIADQFAAGIVYDDDGDGEVSEGEVYTAPTTRLWR